MNLKDIHSVYFIGIGGIGMSALARYFDFIGKPVAGYDKTSTPITDGLQEKGIQVHFEDDIASVPDTFKQPGTLVVYTPAVPSSHGELNFYKANGFEIKKRSEVLGIITKDSYCLAVAGTHGKTTTSCILAHLLKECGLPFTAFLGGISEDFNSNFVLEGTEYSVVEADEFDRSFLRLSPTVACITSMDADHLDIYGTHEELLQSFRDFVGKIKPGGKLFVRKGLPMEGTTFGIEDGSDFCIEHIDIEHGTYVFDLVTPSEVLKQVRFGKPGRHNLLNGLAAFAMAVQTGCPPHRLAEALATFKGVQRRFSYQIKEKDFVFIDDYAHHPAEIDAVHQAIREMHPGEKVTAIFQPHLFSRTKDFADDFAQSLSQFDEIILLDIYPAREEPMEGITSTWLLGKIDNPNKKLVPKAELIKEVSNCKTGVLVALGAGDIGLEVPKIKKELAYAG
ncbi:UDP-N-acetylmuramate--L-alanine ligase [Flagellimonas taeanensis]|uniref:UDP-N-acetylmuramate--L-alanine ligase n=1 Tax=Flavobacteriaceae TaxID=49546 RepID=UPI000E689AA4|nr:MULTISPECIES: UDP-N-acetylmuramate--L-alanine ligase [Allomuricauda]MDC6384286.1 UDP-N-acetylmuramate--L-alanine ligase [Muricauda sp. SK9]RIV49643.1 UDP-N-acetylmuramate--L-alanine ligase [Allomuricauda taeanensis]RIV53842.1 UDP-N-acetylmuramate--L-alanine ligase [Allomuricauda taeanensis]